ncbi:hypothetical protein BVRB_029960, partial [Beta vulgaris subsp. vulgaris]
YYSINISYSKNELEQKMLLNLHKKQWTDSLRIETFDAHSKDNETTVQTLLRLSKSYAAWLKEEDTLSKEELAIAHVGKVDPKKHLETNVTNLMSSNIIQNLGIMLNTVVF